MRTAPAECEAIDDLLDAMADDALPAATAAEVRAHLAACPRCAAEFAAIGALRRDLAALPRPAAPPALVARLRAALPETPAAAPPRRAIGWMAAGLAGLVLGGGAGWFSRGGRPAEELVLHDLLAAHSRALLGAVPPQVASSDSHEVRPWLSARLPVAPRIIDPPGFPLAGARLDLVDGRPVAAVLHHRRRHLITVFAAAEGSVGWPVMPQSRAGFAVHPWIADGVHYVAVSDLNAGELAEFAAALGAGR